MSGKDIVERSKRPVARVPTAPASDSSSAIMELIERVALDPRANVEKLERMMAMYERLTAKRPNSPITQRRAES